MTGNITPEIFVNYWKDHRVLTTKLCIGMTWKVTAHQLLTTTIPEDTTPKSTGGRR